MKPGITITLSRKPEDEEEQLAATILMDIANSCYLAFTLGIGTVPNAVVSELLADKPWLRDHVEKGSKRTVAFVCFYGNHLSLEVYFTKAKVKPLKITATYSMEMRKVLGVSCALNVPTSFIDA